MECLDGCGQPNNCECESAQMEKKNIMDLIVYRDNDGNEWVKAEEFERVKSERDERDSPTITDINKAFYDLVVKERDYERIKNRRIEAERDVAWGTRRLGVE